MWWTSWLRHGGSCRNAPRWIRRRVMRWEGWRGKKIRRRQKLTRLGRWISQDTLLDAWWVRGARFHGCPWWPASRSTDTSRPNRISPSTRISTGNHARWSDVRCDSAMAVGEVCGPSTYTECLMTANQLNEQKIFSLAIYALLIACIRKLTRYLEML